MQDTLSLPFNFEVRGQTATIINAEERIDATISQMKSDSILIRLPDFDAELHVKQTQDVLTGEFFNLSRNEKNIIPFLGTVNTGYRFSDKPEKTTLDISGRWKAKFDGEDEENKFSRIIRFAFMPLDRTVRKIRLSYTVEGVIIGVYGYRKENEESSKKIF